MILAAVHDAAAEAPEGAGVPNREIASESGPSTADTRPPGAHE